MSKKNTIVKNILTILVFFLIIGSLLSPKSISTKKVLAATTHSVSTWKELVEALQDAEDRDIIELTADLIADSTAELNKDINVTIKAEANKTYTVYQKKRDTYDSMFKVSNGKLVFGDGLILSGKTVECTKGDAQAIDGTKPNNYPRDDDDYKKQESAGPVKAKFGSDYGNLSERTNGTTGIKQINIYSQYPDAIEFDIEDIEINGEKIAVLKIGSEYVHGGSNYQVKALDKNSVLILRNTSGNNIKAADIENDGEYLIFDRIWSNKYVKWNGSSLTSSGSSIDDEPVKFKASSVVPGSSGKTYWMIPNEVPITDSSGRVRCDTEEAANAAIKKLNEEIDPIPFKYVPETDKDQEANRYYNDGNGNWINSANVNINDAMDEYNNNHQSCNTNNPACPIDDNGVYTKDSFTGEVGDEYTPKGFFIHVENGTATLNGAVLENFITSRDKDKSPKFVAPVVANGANAIFNMQDGEIRNNTVGYIVNDGKANESANYIKKYIKGGAPNAARVGDYATKKYRRNSKAGIDGDVAGSGITATSGGVIYANGAKGDISGGEIKFNRGDTGGIMVTGTKTEVKILADADVGNNVGVQFGGGVTSEDGALVVMTGGNIHENVAWFGGGGAYVTENGVQWLLGKVDIKDRKDGKFVMDGGTFDSNTAFTRGGGFFVDSDGVSLIKGVIKNNMSRMIGGAMYVMGDDANFTYTVYISEAYVHENKAVSAGNKTDVASDPDNRILSRKLVEPCGCDATITSLFNGQMKVNSDDIDDGYPPYPYDGCDGTGGGIWLCAYGNTVINVDDKNVIIDNNYASGSVVRGKPIKDNKVQEQISSNKAGGNDIHKETKGPGNIVFFGIDNTVKWHDENTGELYTDPAKAVENSIIDFTERNLTNLGEYVPEGYDPNNLGSYSGVNVFGNISRRGGGLAADGTFVFGKAEAMGEAYSELAVTKTWTGGITPEDITIRIQLQYEDENGNEKTLDVIKLPLSEVVKEEPSELDTVFTDGSSVDADGNVVYLGHIVLPITVEDENGNQIQLFDLISNEEKEIDNIGRDVTSGEKQTIPAGETFKLNDAYGLIALGRYLKEGGTVTLSNAKRKLTFVEVKYDADGNEIEVEGYELTPSEMKISGKPTFREEYVTQLQTDGSEKKVGTIITSDVRFEAALYNDKPAEIEKYVNKAVHKDIELDEVFEYDIIAYVKHGTDKLVIEDQLVEDLEFVSSNVKVVSLDENNHLPANNITGEPVNSNASVSKEGSEVANKIVDITENKLTVTIENKLDEIKDVNGNIVGYKNADDGQFLKELWGKWVKVTFNAQIKKEIQNEIESGIKSVSDLKNVSIIDSEVYRAVPSIFDEDKDVEARPTPNIGNDPVESDEDHDGIDNTASYRLEVKNDFAFKDESNTVTVKPQEPSVEKYVNKAVHKDIEIDEEFTYDIIGYITKDADKVIFEDQLVDVLEFVDDVNVEVVYLDGDNHKPLNDINGNEINSDASVNKQGTPVANDGLTIQTTADGKLTVIIDDGVTVDKEAGTITRERTTVKDLRGKYVKVTFNARLKKSIQEELINGSKSIDDLPNVKIKADENKPVLSDEAHNGIDNKATLKIEVLNEARYDLSSNIVTVKPDIYDKSLIVTKIWDDSDDLYEKRPSKISVVLFKDGVKYDSTIITEEDSWHYEFTNLPRNGVYTIEEETVEYYVTKIDGDQDEGFEITNVYRDYLPDNPELDIEQCGEYVLTKKADGSVSKEIEFTFKITMLIDEGLETEKTYTETINLKVDESKTYDFVYNGTKITVEELEADKYNVIYYLDKQRVESTLTTINKGHTSNFDVMNTKKPDKPDIPKTGIE